MVRTFSPLRRGREMLPFLALQIEHLSLRAVNQNTQSTTTRRKLGRPRIRGLRCPVLFSLLLAQLTDGPAVFPCQAAGQSGPSGILTFRRHAG